MTDLAVPESPGDVARVQLERIKRSWVEFAMDLLDFHENERWRDLGYGSLTECVVQELGWAHQQVSRVLVAAQTIAALQSGAPAVRRYRAVNGRLANLHHYVTIRRSYKQPGAKQSRQHHATATASP